MIARLPSLRLTGFLLVVWLLLTESIAFGNVLLGLAFALLFATLARPFMPIPVRVRQSVALGKLLGNALIEIVRSCFNVTRIILFGRYERVNSQFITVPLTLRDPAGLAVLSCIINSTPGTVWVDVLPGSHRLLLHVFDLHDAGWWAETIRTRYEQPLIAIFEEEPA